MTISTAAEKKLEKRKFWEKHINAWKAGNLNQTEYCRHNQLKPHRFTYWKKKLYRPDDTQLTLVPVQITSDLHSSFAPNPSGLKVAVKNQYQIEVDRGFDPVTFKELILILGQQ